MRAPVADVDGVAVVGEITFGQVRLGVLGVVGEADRVTTAQVDVGVVAESAANALAVL